MGTAEREHGSVLHSPALINNQAGCFGAYVNQRRPKFFVIFAQRSLGGSELLQHHIGNNQTGSIDGIDRILSRGYRTGHDVNFDGQPGTDHSYWIIDSILIIYDELLRQPVNNFASGWKLYRACRIDCPAYIFSRDFAITSRNSNYSLAIE